MQCFGKKKDIYPSILSICLDQKSVLLLYHHKKFSQPVEQLQLSIMEGSNKNNNPIFAAAGTYL